MTKIVKKIAVAAVVLAGAVPARANVASAVAPPCDFPRVVENATTPTKIVIERLDLREDSMQRLWSIVTQSAEVSTQLIGMIVAANQNWLGACAYPGIGLAAGAGATELNRTVTIWIWATGVDAAQARRSVVDFVSADSGQPANGVSAWATAYDSGGDDTSTVVQPLTDGSILAAVKSGVGQAGAVSLRRLSASGETKWSVTMREQEIGTSYGSDVSASTLMPNGDAMFAGSVEKLGKTDLQLTRVSSYGVVSRKSVIDSRGNESAQSVAACPDGSVYAGGVSMSSGVTEAFVTRFDEYLNKVWFKRFGAVGNDQLMSLSCDQSGNARVSAWAAGSVLGAGDPTMNNFYLATISRDGSSTRIEATHSDTGDRSPQSGAFSADGSYYVVGELNVARRDARCTEWAIGGSFVSRYNALGAHEWTSELPCGNLNNKVAVDSVGDAYVAGAALSVRVAGEQKFGGRDVLVHRYSLTGERLWTRQLGSSGDDVVSSLALTQSGAVVYGQYESSGSSLNAGVVRFADSLQLEVPATTTTTLPLLENDSAALAISTGTGSAPASTTVPEATAAVTSVTRVSPVLACRKLVVKSKVYSKKLRKSVTVTRVKHLCK